MDTPVLPSPTDTNVDVKPQLELDQSLLFKRLDDTVRDALERWQMEHAKSETADRFIFIGEECYDVIFGLRPDESGPWVGELALWPEHEIVKLTYLNKCIFGTGIGILYKLEVDDVYLYYGIDGTVYLASVQFGSPTRRNGWEVVRVIEGFDLCNLSPTRVLHPISPPGKGRK
jgi:hypothetical protein